MVKCKSHSSHCCCCLCLCHGSVSLHWPILSNHSGKPERTYTCHSHQNPTKEQNLPNSSFHIVMVEPYCSSRDDSQRDPKHADNAHPMMVGEVLLPDVSHHWEVDPTSKLKDQEAEISYARIGREVCSDVESETSWGSHPCEVGGG